MLDLSTLPKLPNYEFKLHDGTVRSYDALLIGYALRILEGEKEPQVIKAAVNKVLEIDVDAVTAIQILDDFTKFSAEFLEEPLKNALGREPSSSTTSDSGPAILKE